MVVTKNKTSYLPWWDLASGGNLLVALTGPRQWRWPYTKTSYLPWWDLASGGNNWSGLGLNGSINLLSLKNHAKDKQCCGRTWTLFAWSADDRKSIATGALGGVGLPRLGLSFEEDRGTEQLPPSTLAWKHLEFGLLGNSEELLWHRDVMAPYGRAHASVALGDVEGFELKTCM